MTTEPESNSAWFFRGWVPVFAVLFASSGLATRAHSQNLADPMRPPDFVDASGAIAQKPSAAGSGLQAIKFSRDRRFALIDGQVVSVGDKVGDATLVSLSESAAVMKDADGKRVTLRLLPQGEKTIAGKKPRSTGPRGGQ